MLKTILADYLNISPDQAESFMAFLTRDEFWKNKEFSTQGDLIQAIQEHAQKKWFQGADRSTFSDNTDGDAALQKLYSMFENVGLTRAINYDKSSLGDPHFSVVLGSQESEVLRRVRALREDFLKSVLPKENVVFGLGCNRQLGVSAVNSEEQSKLKLEEKDVEPNEMNMVTLFVTDMIDELGLDGLKYSEVNTASTATSRKDANCVKTGDTATTLKGVIESDFSVTGKPVVVVYSSQPFVLRQQRDIENKLGPDYTVIGVGEELTQDLFNKTSKSITICMGELARLFNIGFTPANLAKYKETPLSVEDKTELKTKAEKPNSPLQANSFLASPAATSPTGPVSEFRTLKL